MHDHAKKKKSVLNESRKFVWNGRKVIRENRGCYKFRCFKTIKIPSIIKLMLKGYCIYVHPAEICGIYICTYS